MSSPEVSLPFFLPFSSSSATFSAPETPSTTFISSALPASIFSSLVIWGF